MATSPSSHSFYWWGFLEMGKLVKFEANKVKFHTKLNKTGFWYKIKSNMGLYLKKSLLYLVFFSKNNVVFKETNLGYHSCTCKVRGNFCYQIGTESFG